MPVTLKAIVSKLNDTTRKALEDAAGLCLARTHYDVEIEHFLMKLMDATDSDFARILKQFGVDKSRLSAELSRSLDKLKTGNARTPSFSPSLHRMLTEGWTIGSLEFGGGQVRTGFTTLALVSDEELARIVRDISKELQKIEPGSLRKQLPAILEDSREYSAQPAAAGVSGGGAPGAPGMPKAGGKTPNLDQFTVNLTDRAKQGKIDPVLGRDFEIRQLVDILLRRRQNNPILTGEAGVGKTAVVEGFALRVALGDVPPPLKNVSVRTLDLALLQAGAGIKGEFENRLKGLIEEVKASPTPIILFIDEAHTMIGAGGQAGQGDAANLLKPALARGELRTIAATTWSEYKKYFEKDPALARRFQVVKVEEPIETQCMTMLRGIVPSLEQHHKVRILDEGLTAAVHLSHRYLAGRQLPDKAVSVLDTACARLALGQSATPSAIEDSVRQIDDLAVQQRILERESAVGTDHRERLEEIATKSREIESRLGRLRTRFEKESDLVTTIRDLRSQLENAAASRNGNAGVAAPGAAASSAEIPGVAGDAGAPGAVATAPAAASSSATAVAVEEAPKTLDVVEVRAQLAQAEADLAALQGETPMIRVAVDAQIVGEVISAWTGIPVGKMMKDEISTVL